MFMLTDLIRLTGGPGLLLQPEQIDDDVNNSLDRANNDGSIRFEPSQLEFDENDPT
jgi:hypothetical protein